MSEPGSRSADRSALFLVDKPAGKLLSYVEINAAVTPKWSDQSGEDSSERWR